MSPPSAPGTSMISKERSRLALGLLCVVLCAGAPAPCIAEAAPPAEPTFSGLYERALAAYHAERYAAAIEELQAAYKLQPEPRLLFNIAQSYRKLGNAQRAREMFERYLEADPDVAAEMKAEIQRYIAELAAQERATVLAVPPAANSAPAPYRMARWHKALGALLLVSGSGLTSSGAIFLSLDGQCTAEPLPPALECPRLYQLLAPGAAQIAIGSGLLIAGALTLVIPAAKAAHARSQPAGRSK